MSRMKLQLEESFIFGDHGVTQIKSVLLVVFSTRDCTETVYIIVVRMFTFWPKTFPCDLFLKIIQCDFLL